MDDVKLVGIRVALLATVREHLPDDWLPEGCGIWRRQNLDVESGSNPGALQDANAPLGVI